MSTVTDELAEIVAAMTIDQLPPEVADGAIRAIDRVLSLSARGCSDPLMTIVRAALSEMDDEMAATTGRLSVSSTALTMATSAAWQLPNGTAELDRFASAVVPVSFVVARATSCGGAKLVLAVAVGLETALRSAAALGRGHTAKGWDPVGSAGRIGATLAADVILGLDPSMIANSLGFAATTACGLRVGGEALRALVAGKVASDALEAAYLAQCGLVGPSQPLEGRRGLFALLAPDGDPSRITHELGRRWSVISSGASLGLGGPARALPDGDIVPLVEAFETLCKTIN